MLRRCISSLRNVANKCSTLETRLFPHEKQLLSNLLLSVDKGPINVFARNPNVRCKFIDYVSDSADLCKLTRDWILKRVDSTDIIHQFNNFVTEKFYPQLCSLRNLSLITDLSRPDKIFPNARQLDRRIFIHHGPPNSGKTHSSIEKLIKAKTGVYCAPLRLMAYEVYDKLVKAGVETNLLTGQKIIMNQGSTHLVCTIEMLPTSKFFDLGIIDEMQMIADDSRGFAWSRAFFAMQAKEIHLCGSSCAIPIFTTLANQCNEPVHIVEYNRMALPVKICENPITLDDLRPKDCLVSFYPTTLFQYKSKLDCLGKKSCILYGSLPPETRLSQIKKFNKGHHILLATDIIGIGLNLDIQRVIMAGLEKSVDGNNRLLTPLELSQIINRAGRYNISSGIAEASVLNESLLENFRKILSAKNENLSDIQITPEASQLVSFVDSIKVAQDEDISPATLVKTFKNLANIVRPYKLSQFDKMGKISICLDGINLSTVLVVEYLKAPLDTNHQVSLASLRLFASRHADGLKIQIKDLIDLNKFNLPIDNIAKLKLYELIYNILDYYQYMSFRYPAIYIDASSCEEFKKCIYNEINSLVDSKIEPNFYYSSDETTFTADIENFSEYLSDESRGALNYILCKFNM